jgi:hypothetical protein
MSMLWANSSSLGKDHTWYQAVFEMGPFVCRMRRAWSCRIRGMWTTCVSFSLVCFSKGLSHEVISAEDSARFTFPVFTFVHVKFNNKAGTLFLT